jgi:hypothetical protein
MKLSPGQWCRCCGAVQTRLVVANHRLGFACVLKHADKKSKHDCFSFLQATNGRLVARILVKKWFQRACAPLMLFNNIGRASPAGIKTVKPVSFFALCYIRSLPPLSDP